MKDTARLSFSGGTDSAAAKRYCWLNAVLAPNSMAAPHSSQKSCRTSATDESTAPLAPTEAPNMKPARRPMRRISSAAGAVVSATAMTAIEIGIVAHDGRGASSAATMPPSSTSTIRPVPVSACAQASTRTPLKRPSAVADGISPSLGLVSAGGFLEHQHELIGLAPIDLARGLGAIVGRMTQQVAFLHQLEAHAGHVLLHQF